MDSPSSRRRRAAINDAPRRGFARVASRSVGRLHVEPLEDRHMLAAVPASMLGLGIELYADNAGSPGAEISPASVALGQTFWVKVLVQDERTLMPTSPPTPAPGVIALALNLSFDTSTLEIESPPTTFTPNSLLASDPLLTPPITSGGDTSFPLTRFLDSYNHGIGDGWTDINSSPVAPFAVPSPATLAALRGAALPNGGFGTAIGTYTGDDFSVADHAQDVFSEFQVKALKPFVNSPFTIQVDGAMSFADAAQLSGVSTLYGHATASGGLRDPDVDKESLAVTEFLTVGTGTISWEKRSAVAPFDLLPGATFTVTPNPQTGSGTLTVVDGGANDADGADNGVFQVTGALPGTYTVAETAAPGGYGVDSVSRTVTVSAATPNPVIGTQGQDDPGETNTSDFHDTPIGTISWEKRSAVAPFGLLAGATFTVTPNPQTGSGTLTVVDGGGNDSDGLSNGSFTVNHALPGTYTITETVAPGGFAVDPTPTRTVTLTDVVTSATVGTQGQDDPGETNESDFHDQPIGTISWEKRSSVAPFALLAGATFTVTPNPQTGSGTLTVIDGGANDADGADNGSFTVNQALPGTYTITETVAPGGFAIDPTPTRTVTLTAAAFNVAVGTQGQDDPGETNTSDFHDAPVGTIEWEKRSSVAPFALLAGATFTVTPNPQTGSGTLTVVDGGANDADGANDGSFTVNHALPGTYTITETIAPGGFAMDPTPTRSVTLTSVAFNVAVGTQGQDDPGETNESDFHDQPIGTISWEKRSAVAPFGLLTSATFTVTPNPQTGSGTLTVVDGGANDADGANNGSFTVNHALPGTYTITETVAPGGFALDPAPTRSVTLTSVAFNITVGTQGQDDPGESQTSDFHDAPIGTIQWEKRNAASPFALLAGATFTITPNPKTGSGTLTVADGGANDADGTSNGSFTVNAALPGTYTISETTAPPNFNVDPTATRNVTLTSASFNVTVGTQGQDDPGETNTSDFHDAVIVTGSISWEKRNAASPFGLLAGATFTVTPNPLTGSGSLTVTDGGANDADGTSNGVFKVNGAKVGTYTVSETTPPAGFSLDPVPTRSVTVTAAALNVTIGTQGQNDAGEGNSSDFHDAVLVATSLSGYVYADTNLNGVFDRDASGAPLEIGLPNVVITLLPSHQTTTTAPDGSYEFANLPAGTYGVVMTQPAGFIADTANHLGVVLPSGAAVGAAGLEQFSGIALAAGQQGVDYSFGQNVVPTKLMFLASADPMQTMFSNLGVSTAVVRPSGDVTLDATSTQLVVSAASIGQQQFARSSVHALIIDNRSGPGTVTLHVPDAGALANLGSGSGSLRVGDDYSGTDFGLLVLGAQRVVATGTQNAGDRAVLHDAPGSDSLVSTGTTATLTYAAGRQVQVTGFDAVVAQAPSHGDTETNTSSATAPGFSLELDGDWTTI